jgi:predicted TIM-barrel fold metal-dependent hydrolase
VIVDVHCHAGVGTGMRGPWDTHAPLGRHLERSAGAGIDLTVVVPVFHDDYGEANEQLARIVRRHPGRLVGFAGLHPQRDRLRLERLVGRAVEVLGLRGLKIHGAEAWPDRPTCALAVRFGLPILWDIVRDTMRLEMLARSYPELTFIVPHLGAFADDWRTHLAVIDQLCRFPNVFADTSGVRYFDALREAARRAGPGKLLFGSDGPQIHPALELAKVRLLGLPPAAERAITGGNAARLLHLAEGGPRRRHPATKGKANGHVRLGA